MIDWDKVTPEEWDTARRVSDAVNLHIAATPDARGFVACRMDDGRSNGDLYDTRRDAVRHHMKAGQESNYLYIKVVPGGITPRSAWVMVVAFRKLRDAGIRPDHEDVQLPHQRELLAGIDRRLAVPRLTPADLVLPDTFRR
ncbi:hypothetical protein ACGF12_35870 [Kitasatospora sp. NPDC048296]|uniref:hypothetical protein n=1 Tax=Kitasatospora sp. NPDC048296 TaxID=3364048 RepID=UPI0037212BFF